MQFQNPCELCIIKPICRVLCREKIDQVSDKIMERKKLKNPNFSKRGGVLLWDFMDELALEGKIIIRYYGSGGIEVKNGVIKRPAASP